MGEGGGEEAAMARKEDKIEEGRGREGNIATDRKTGRCGTEKETDRQTDRQTDIQTDRQTESWHKEGDGCGAERPAGVPTATEAAC